MYQKLFQITLVLFLAVVSIVMLGLIASAVLSEWSPSLLARDGDSIVVVAGGVSQKLFGVMVVAGSLVVAGLFIFFRRRRFRR
jgi:hypothetical protein